MFEFARWLGSTPLSTAIVSIPWLARILLTLHIVTAGIVLGSVLMIVLRVHARGVRADEPFEQTWFRFAAWFWYSLAAMALTGIIMAICEPLREVSALSFWLKMVLIVVGSSGVRWLGRSIRARQGAEIPASTRHAATLILVMWMTVILLGRAIGYDKAIWGALSLKNYL
jgi:putative copper export protein